MRTIGRGGENLWRLAIAPARIALDAEFRTLVALRVFHADRLHQPTVLTRMNRYPRIFGACRRLLADRTEPRLLSYGCATGEEVLTLRRYFPTAFIVGAEINPRSLARCRALPVDDRMTFVESDHARIARLGPYDAVFCMAVLQHGPHGVQQRGITDISRIYPFEKFDREVERLDRHVAPGGLFVIQHAQYDFEDASVAARYAPRDEGPSDGLPRFDRRGRRKPDRATATSVFSKER